MVEKFGKRPGIIYTGTEFLDTAVVGIRILNKKDLDILYVNRMMEEMFGYKKDELTGKPLSVLYYDDGEDPRVRIEGIKRELSEKGEWHGEIRHVRKDGTTFWGYATTLSINYSDFGECYLTIENDISETKRLEEELEKSREQYRLIADNIVDCIWDYDIKVSKFNYISPSVKSLFGYEMDEARTLPIGRYMADEFKEQIVAKYRERWSKIENGTAENSVFVERMPLKRKDGSVFFGEIKGIFIMGMKGEARLLGITRDVTKETMLAMEVEKSREQYRVVVDNISDVVWDFDPERNKYNYVSPSSSILLGYEPEDLKEKSIFDLLTDESLKYANERFGPRMDAFLRGDSIPSFYYDQVDLKRKDGSILHAEVKTRFVRGDNGKVKFVGISRDITNEMELLKRLEFLKLAIDNAAEAIFLLDNDTRFTYINPAFVQTTGYMSDEIIGKDTLIIRDNSQDPRLYEGIWTVLKSEDVWKGPLVNRKKDGSLYYSNTNISAIRGASNDVLGYVVVQYDMTKQRVLENLVKDKEKLSIVGQFAGAIAHEIKNPLFAITGGLQLLQYESNLTEEQRRELDVLYKEAMRIDRLIKQLRVHTRPVELKIEPLELDSILDELSVILRAVLAKKRIKFVLDYPDNLPLLHADRDGMEQVLLNLALNSIEGCEEDGKIDMKCRVENDLMILTIEDDGVGIEEEYIPHVFSPLFSTKPGNTGLGLFVCKKLVTEHNGDISVVSTRGKGTKFTVRLPLRRRPGQ